MAFTKKILILSILFLASCQKPASHTVRSTNSKFKVEVLFEVDGIRVYRFEDNGRDHYFCSRGSQGICMSGHTETCGKHHRIYIPEEIVNYE